MKLCIMQSSLTTCYFFPFRSKYIPQHPFLRYPESKFLFYCYRSYLTVSKIIVLNELICIFSRQIGGQRILTCTLHMDDQK